MNQIYSRILGADSQIDQNILITEVTPTQMFETEKEAPKALMEMEVPVTRLSSLLPSVSDWVLWGVQPCTVLLCSWLRSDTRSARMLIKELAAYSRAALQAVDLVKEVH